MSRGLWFSHSSSARRQLACYHANPSACKSSLPLPPTQSHRTAYQRAWPGKIRKGLRPKGGKEWTRNKNYSPELFLLRTSPLSPPQKRQYIFVNWMDKWIVLHCLPFHQEWLGFIRTIRFSLLKKLTSPGGCTCLIVHVSVQLKCH